MDNGAADRNQTRDTVAAESCKPMRNDKQAMKLLGIWGEDEIPRPILWREPLERTWERGTPRRHAR